MTAGSTDSDSSLKPPRTPRFAEATSVHSPVEDNRGRSPFADPEKDDIQAVGFGYINNGADESSSGMAPKSPLKSAMKVPGTPARNFTNPLSPTFREEERLEKREASTDVEQARDLVSRHYPPREAPKLVHGYGINLDWKLTFFSRESKLAFAWPSLPSAASTLAAPSSSSP